MRNLEDPFEDLTPPDNPISRSLSCPSSSVTYTADETVTITTEYHYFTGSNRNRLTAYPGYPNPQVGSNTVNGPTNITFNSSPSDNSVPTNIYEEVSGKGINKVWEQLHTVTAKTYDNIVNTTSGSTDMQPGTYSDFTLSCNTTLAGGVYVIDGGELNVNAQNSLTGSGVMFVLKNGAGIKINGNASTVMNGVVYLPNSNLTLLGTSRGVSECLQIASKTLDIGGTADMSTLCPADVEPKGAVSTSNSVVRLVA